MVAIVMGSTFNLIGSFYSNYYFYCVTRFFTAAGMFKKYSNKIFPFLLLVSFQEKSNKLKVRCWQSALFLKACNYNVFPKFTRSKKSPEKVYVLFFALKKRAFLGHKNVRQRLAADTQNTKKAKITNNELCSRFTILRSGQLLYQSVLATILNYILFFIFKMIGCNTETVNVFKNQNVLDRLCSNQNQDLAHL